LLFKEDMLAVRKYLLKNADVWAIISLPMGVFRPYAESKTDIIVFEKSKKGTKAVWFYNLEADGFDINSDYRLPVDENDIPDLLGKWNERRVSPKSWVADIKSIEESGFDLLAQTYEPIEQKAEKGLRPLRRPSSNQSQGRLQSKRGSHTSRSRSSGMGRGPSSGE
jgi:type I restriction-modification system DNA methylase subunit